MFDRIRRLIESWLSLWAEDDWLDDGDEIEFGRVMDCIKPCEPPTDKKKNQESIIR